MRVVSLVPSWTETLMEAGVEVVGRSRYCVHPADRVGAVPVVGGTKDVDWEAVDSARPGVVLLDKEENPRWMAEQSRWEVLATHVQSVDDAGVWMEAMGARLDAPGLVEMAERWRAVVGALRARAMVCDGARIPGGIPGGVPGVVRWVRRPVGVVERVVYVIWQRPWMSVGRGTFIGSMLELLGCGELLPAFDEAYPEVDLESFDPARTLVLASSEPFPFAERPEALEALPHACAIVDGAAYSWFGVRALRFVEGVAGE